MVIGGHVSRIPSRVRRRSHNREYISRLYRSIDIGLAVSSGLRGSKRASNSIHYSDRRWGNSKERARSVIRLDRKERYSGTHSGSLICVHTLKGFTWPAGTRGVCDYTYVHGAPGGLNASPSSNSRGCSLIWLRLKARIGFDIRKNVRRKYGA